MPELTPLICEITFRKAAPRDIAAVRSLIPFEVVYESSFLLTIRGDGHSLTKGQKHLIAALAKQKKLTLNMHYASVAA